MYLTVERVTTCFTTCNLPFNTNSCSSITFKRYIKKTYEEIDWDPPPMKKSDLQSTTVANLSFISNILDVNICCNSNVFYILLYQTRKKKKWIMCIVDNNDFSFQEVERVINNKLCYRK